MVAGLWIGILRRNGEWSCAHFMGKALLPTKSWTIPMRELHALWMAAVLMNLCVNLLQDWFENKLKQRYLFGDSRIALAYLPKYETSPLPQTQGE